LMGGERLVEGILGDGGPGQHDDRRGKHARWSPPRRLGWARSVAPSYGTYTAFEPIAHPGSSPRPRGRCNEPGGTVHALPSRLGPDAPTRWAKDRVGRDGSQAPGTTFSRSEPMKPHAPGLLSFALVAAGFAPFATARGPSRVVRHVVVSREEGRFAGWPA